MIVLSNAPWASPLMSHYYYFYYQNSKLSFILDGAVSAIEPAVLKESYASLYTLVLEAAKHDADSSSIRWVKIIAGLLLVYSVKKKKKKFPPFYGGEGCTILIPVIKLMKCKEAKRLRGGVGRRLFPFLSLPPPFAKPTRYKGVKTIFRSINSTVFSYWRCHGICLLWIVMYTCRIRCLLQLL